MVVTNECRYRWLPRRLVEKPGSHLPIPQSWWDQCSRGSWQPIGPSLHPGAAQFMQDLEAKNSARRAESFKRAKLKVTPWLIDDSINGERLRVCTPGMEACCSTRSQLKVMTLFRSKHDPDRRGSASETTTNNRPVTPLPAQVPEAP
jgi:hypothetical protein